jgi:hypothetical protein
MFETIPQSGGFLRAALWANNSSAGGSVDSTHQAAIVRVGFAKEFHVAPSQTIGLEVLAGGGRIWGTAPTYDRFFGGNASAKFLYDSPDATTMTDLPAGPVLRSFGEGAAGIRVGNGIVGGTQFWHINVDLAAPIPRWSEALIPNDKTDIPGKDGEDLTLKQLLAVHIETSESSLLESALEGQGMSQEAAQARTKEVMQEIRPGALYIINDANLIAVKPLLLFDAAGISAPEGSENWMSVGAGLQVTVAVVKLEVGYNQTIHGPTYGNRGAAFARLVFQRLFL